METYLLSHEILGDGFQVISIRVDLRNLRLVMLYQRFAGS
jgi:hypothetical protein